MEKNKPSTNVNTDNTKDLKTNNENTINNEEKNLPPQKKNIIKNYMFNALFQVFLIIVPLIVTPYISRVLSPEGIGQFSFSNSIITYFSIFAALGFNLYGQREISKHQGNKQAQTKIFWEIVIVRIFTTISCLIINLTLCGLNVYGEYNILMFILTINIFAVIFDLTFRLRGNEQFGKLFIRKVIVNSSGIV